MNLEKNLNRRSCRSFSNQEVGASQFASFITDVSNALTEAEQSKKQDRFFLLNSFYSWTRIFIAVQGVEGLSRGIYELNPANLSLNLIRLNFKDEEFSALIAHQNWFQGGGFIVLIGAQWERYQWLYRHSRAYINLLFQLGELGQELIQSYTNLDLGGWMTPAVDEAKANLLCNLNDADGVDILYFHKIGIPQ